MLTIPKLHPGDRFPGCVEPRAIACVNWPAEFPDRPGVTFSAAHTGGALLLAFRVEEQYTLARVTQDNGPVWTDSCVEFFISFDRSGYYNFEFNCIGTMLLGFRKEKDNALHASLEVLATIVRRPSLGREPFEERSGGQRWELEASIPVAAFFRHRIGSLDGLRARANFYKCGDGLTRPHFLSWNPVGTPTPNFHKEEFFGDIRFE